VSAGAWSRLERPLTALQKVSSPLFQNGARTRNPRAKGFPKNRNSDDHFDRSFLFMAVKGNYETKKKEITATRLERKI
jgi:hypothetical protein